MSVEMLMNNSEVFGSIAELLLSAAMTAKACFPLTHQTSSHCALAAD